MFRGTYKEQKCFWIWCWLPSQQPIVILFPLFIWHVDRFNEIAFPPWWFWSSPLIISSALITIPVIAPICSCIYLSETSNYDEGLTSSEKELQLLNSVTIGVLVIVITIKKPPCHLFPSKLIIWCFPLDSLLIIPFQSIHCPLWPYFYSNKSQNNMATWH